MEEQSGFLITYSKRNSQTVLSHIKSCKTRRLASLLHAGDVELSLPCLAQPCAPGPWLCTQGKRGVRRAAWQGGEMPGKNGAARAPG